jgi:hypothetical protein
LFKNDFGKLTGEGQVKALVEKLHPVSTGCLGIDLKATDPKFGFVPTGNLVARSIGPGDSNHVVGQANIANQ